MDMMLSDCSNAANEMSRNGGFAPAQCVLGCLPRAPPTMDDEEECLEHLQQTVILRVVQRLAVHLQPTVVLRVVQRLAVQLQPTLKVVHIPL